MSASEPSKTSGSGGGLPVEQFNAEVFDRLAKAARQRFDSRRTIEWQVCYGIWAAFGLGAGFAVGSDKWTPAVFEAITGSGIAVLAVFVFYMWTSERHNYSQRDAQTAYFWESAMEKQTGIPLPEALRPPPDWPRVSDPRTTPASGAGSRTYIYQTIMTLLFSSVFSFALMSRSKAMESSWSEVSVGLVTVALISLVVATVVFFLLYKSQVKRGNDLEKCVSSLKEQMAKQ